MATIPWVEKYRPSTFDGIILSEINEKILTNMIDKNKFLNLILYGPPGTGKTSTIINIINSFQDKCERRDRSLVMHLNASDERGIDIIRNQINTFVKSKHIWKNGTKFVILDEVDYMTRVAQNSLRYLVDEDIPNVRFCLICNYIYKLDVSLIQYFAKLRFNHVPKDKITKLLRTISDNENLKCTDEYIHDIHTLCGSDIRRMINVLQCNSLGTTSIHNSKLILDITNRIKDKTLTHNAVMDIAAKYNINIKFLMISYINHMIMCRTVNEKLIETAEYIIESNNILPEILTNYFILSFYD
jgi:replication factor C subunit 3/5